MHAEIYLKVSVKSEDLSRSVPLECDFNFCKACRISFWKIDPRTKKKAALIMKKKKEIKYVHEPSPKEKEWEGKEWVQEQRLWSFWMWDAGGFKVTIGLIELKARIFFGLFNGKSV